MLKSVQYLLLLMSITLGLPVSQAFAEEKNTTSYTASDTAQTSSVTTNITTSPYDAARQWNLTNNEWQHYQLLMQGSSGKWYPQLDPDEVLGLYAQTDAERDYYAELVVKHAHERIERELAFQRAYDRAQKKLYPALPIIGDIRPLSKPR